SRGRCRSRYQTPPVAIAETRASTAAIGMTAAGWLPAGAVAVGPGVGWLPTAEASQSYWEPWPELQTDTLSWLAGSCWGGVAWAATAGLSALRAASVGAGSRMGGRGGMG